MDHLKKMPVYLVAKIFSVSVVAGMNTHLALGNLSFESRFTISVMYEMDKLFNIFNSNKILNNKSRRWPFKNTSQIEHLSMMLLFFKKLKIISKVNNFISGWLISIYSLLKLWHSLKKSTEDPNSYTKYVVVFYILIDKAEHCLENLFDMFCNRNGNNWNSTPVQFYNAL